MNYIGFKGRECNFFFLRNIKANIKVIIFFFMELKFGFMSNQHSGEKTDFVG